MPEASLPTGEIVALTGHRPDKLGYWDPGAEVVVRVKDALRRTLVALAPSLVRSGMALGVDQWGARICVDLGVPFMAALPCDDMESRWPEASRAEFRRLILLAREVHVVSPGPYKPWKMQRRNEWMVDNSGRLVAIHDGSAGGTWNCVAYADHVGRPITRPAWR